MVELTENLSPEHAVSLKRGGFRPLVVTWSGVTFAALILRLTGHGCADRRAQCNAECSTDRHVAKCCAERSAKSAPDSGPLSNNGLGRLIVTHISNFPFRLRQTSGITGLPPAMLISDSTPSATPVHTIFIRHFDLKGCQDCEKQRTQSSHPHTSTTQLTRATLNEVDREKRSAQRRLFRIASMRNH